MHLTCFMFVVNLHVINKVTRTTPTFFFVSLNRFHALFGVSVVGFEQVNDGLERSSENKIRKTLKRQSG